MSTSKDGPMSTSKDGPMTPRQMMKQLEQIAESPQSQQLEKILNDQEKTKSAMEDLGRQIQVIKAKLKHNERDMVEKAINECITGIDTIKSNPENMSVEGQENKSAKGVIRGMVNVQAQMYPYMNTLNANLKKMNLGLTEVEIGTLANAPSYILYLRQPSHQSGGRFWDGYNEDGDNEDGDIEDGDIKDGLAMVATWVCVGAGISGVCVLACGPCAIGCAAGYVIISMCALSNSSCIQGGGWGPNVYGGTKLLNELNNSSKKDVQDIARNQMVEQHPEVANDIIRKFDKIASLVINTKKYVKNFILRKKNRNATGATATGATATGGKRSTNKSKKRGSKKRGSKKRGSKKSTRRKSKLNRR